MDIALITVSVMVVLIAAVLILWPQLLRYYLRNYYRQYYAPVKLAGSKLPKYPAEHHLTNVPWIVSPFQLCQSTTLQMIAASHGINYPRANFDFLMAFTYGASSVPNMLFSPLGTDPEMGLLTAAPYLGLKRVYAVTEDASLLLANLRSNLAKGYPVRLALDEGSLYGKQEVMAHSVVLVGYDAEGFYYYEPVGLPPSPVEPGERPAGEKGLYVKDAVLLTAVEKLSKLLRYPWQYHFTIFQSAPLENDLGPVWLQAGKAMAEEIKYGPRVGARVIEDLAGQIQREGPKFEFSKVTQGMTLAAQTRQDNAEFLRTNFSLHADLLEAAHELEQAAQNYRLVVEDIERGVKDKNASRRVASRLLDAASAERKAGEIFLKRGNPKV